MPKSRRRILRASDVFSHHRTFNGIEYWFYNVFFERSDAEAQARRMKQVGDKIRIVPKDAGYTLNGKRVLYYGLYYVPNYDPSKVRRKRT